MAPPPAPMEPPPPPPPPVPLPSTSNEPTNAPSGQVGTPQGGFRQVENAQVGRAYLVGDAVYGPTKLGLPFGVILLRPSETARNQALCNAFVNNIEETETIREIDPAINIIATYWLLRTDVSAADKTDCNRLLANYNYARASRILAGYGRATSRGPVFLALHREAGGTPNVAFLDLNGRTPQQVAAATVDWFSVIVDEGDVTEVPNEPREQARKRGFFAKIVRLVGKMACDVFLPNPPASAVAYTNLTFIDPYLNDFRGTLRVVVGASGLVAAGGGLLAQTFCPARQALSRIEGATARCAPV